MIFWINDDIAWNVTFTGTTLKKLDLLDMSNLQCKWDWFRAGKEPRKGDWGSRPTVSPDCTEDKAMSIKLWHFISVYYCCINFMILCITSVLLVCSAEHATAIMTTNTDGDGMTPSIIYAKIIATFYGVIPATSVLVLCFQYIICRYVSGYVGCHMFPHDNSW